MALVKWHPRSDMTSLWHEMDRLFGMPMPGVWRQEERSWMPRVDMRETETSYVIEADLPGVAKDDITVTVEDKTLLIMGQRKVETPSDADGLKHVERAFGSFQRAFRLPTTVNVDEIVAQYHDGVLTVNVPKSDDAKTKRITIQAA